MRKTVHNCPQPIDSKEPNYFVDKVYPSGGIVLVMAKLPRLKCTRCGHKWIPKQDALPTRCAAKNCKSPYWNKPRRKIAA